VAQFLGGGIDEEVQADVVGFMERLIHNCGPQPRRGRRTRRKYLQADRQFLPTDSYRDDAVYDLFISLGWWWIRQSTRTNRGCAVFPPVNTI
jgi:hypothetical protein